MNNRFEENLNTIKNSTKLFSTSKFMKLPDIKTIPKPFEFDKTQ